MGNFVSKLLYEWKFDIWRKYGPIRLACRSCENRGSYWIDFEDKLSPAYSASHKCDACDVKCSNDDYNRRFISATNFAISMTHPNVQCSVNAEKHTYHITCKIAHSNVKTHWNVYIFLRILNGKYSNKEPMQIPSTPITETMPTTATAMASSAWAVYFIKTRANEWETEPRQKKRRENFLLSSRALRESLHTNVRESMWIDIERKRNGE